MALASPADVFRRDTFELWHHSDNRIAGDVYEGRAGEIVGKLDSRVLVDTRGRILGVSVEAGGGWEAT
jgi:hypothetical protein